MSNLVSICILSYNNAKYIQETLDSIANQTYRHVELIVLDDGSTDDSCVVIQDWIVAHRKEVHARLLENPTNKGVTYSCNKVIAHANGDYIVLFGSDDIMRPDRITYQLMKLDSLDPQYLALSNDVRLIDEGGNQIGDSFFDKLLREKRIEAGDIDLMEMLHQNVVPAPGLMIRKTAFQLLGKYDERLAFEDYDMNLRMLVRGKVYWDPEPVAYYRVKKESLGSKIYHLHYDFAITYSKCIDYQDQSIRSLATMKFIEHLYPVLMLSRKLASELLKQVPCYRLNNKLIQYWMFAKLPIPRRWLKKPA